MLRTIALFFFFFPAFLQAEPDSLIATRHLEAANACLGRNQLDSARMLHRAALDIFKKNDWLDKWLESHTVLAYTWADVVSKPLEGEDLLDAALKEMWRPPANSQEWVQLTRIHLFKGFLYKWYIFEYSNAVEAYEKAFGLFVSKLGEKNDKIASHLYHQLGNLYTILGDYQRAEFLLKRGIDYGKSNQKPEIGKYGDLAIVLIDLGKNKEALDVIQEGLVVSGADADALITARLSQARAWLNLGDSRQSIAAVSEVPALIAKMQGNTQEKAYYQAGYHAMSGAIQDFLGNDQAAVQHFRKTIQFETLSQGTPFAREVGKAHYSLANFYLKKNQPAKALLEFQQVLQCVLRDFKPKNADENPAHKLFYAENTIIEGLIGKAEAFKKLNQFEKALQCYELIPYVEAKLRATHAYKSSSLLALDDSRQRFDEAVALAWQLYEQSNHEVAYAERAFLLSEKARGMLLLQSLARAQADYQLPDDIRKKENDLRAKMAWYEHEIAALKDKSQRTQEENERLKRLEKEQFDLTQEQTQFKALLRDSFPEYDRLLREIKFLEVQDVPKLLRAEQAMLVYYLTETDAYIFCFDASGMFTWRKSSLPGKFRESVSALAQYLYKGDENDKNGRVAFLHTASALHDSLLAPELSTAAPGIRSLMIVPDDALAFIPFEVLLRSPVDAAWRKLPWLLRDYSIGYAYSATLLMRQQAISFRHRQEALPQYVLGGFAPSYSSVSSSDKVRGDTVPLPNYPIYDIKNTQAELRKVHDLIGGNAYYGKDATEERFNDIADECRVLLLAMHGYANDEYPELSCLLFGIPNKDSVRNNVLYASELQIMQLHADLAVLSACHTGFGKLHKGEGVYSLARALAEAGVPCTVMSLWRLHENTAPLLMEAFFRHLKSGKTKDEALRLAKLEFLDKDENYEMTHPFYWAGVMVTGDMCPLDLPDKPFPWWMILAGAAGAAGALLWFWWRKKPRVKP